MLIKKLVIPLVSSITLGTSVMASEYKIGDKMPIFENEVVVHEQAWSKYDGSQYGILKFFDKDNDRQADFFRVYKNCSGKNVLFGYWDGKNLYLDNKPNDGRIDEIHNTIEGRKASEDTPPCKGIII